jgi:uncharacterized protein YoaH (UPF0181 family)
MATYGRGQMLGSGINPESFKLDYSGMANAAATQAQGVASLGASIGGAIAEVGDYFKKQAEDEKKVQKSLSVAKAIGDLIPGLQPTIQGSLNILNDKELPLSQRTAEADAIADILNLGINEVRNRQDVGFKERELGIREAEALARNAPPMPAPRTYKREDAYAYGGGFLEGLQRGSDGQLYDEGLNLIMDIDAFARGEAPEVYSGYSNFSDDLGDINTPAVFMPGENPAANIDYASGLGGSPQTASFPTNLNVPSPTPFINAGRIDAERINAALDGGVLPPKQEIAALERVLGIDESERREIKSRIRFDADKEKAAKEPEGTEMTLAEVEELASKGVKINAVPLGGGKFRVTESTFGNKPMVEVNTGQTDQQERSKKMDAMLFETKKQLEGASQNKDSITKMVNLIDEGVKTGFARETIMKFNRAFGRDVSDAETFRSVSGDVAMGFINLTKGAISDREMTYFTTVLAPNLGNTPEGNKKIGAFMLGAVKKAEKIEKVISEGLSEGRNAFDIDKEVRAIRNADDLLSDTTGGESTPEKPQSAADRLRALPPVQ